MFYEYWSSVSISRLPTLIHERMSLIFRYLDELLHSNIINIINIIMHRDRSSLKKNEASRYQIEHVTVEDLLGFIDHT